MTITCQIKSECHQRQVLGSPIRTVARTVWPLSSTWGRLFSRQGRKRHPRDAVSLYRREITVDTACSAQTQALHGASKRRRRLSQPQINIVQRRGRGLVTSRTRRLQTESFKTAWFAGCQHETAASVGRITCMQCIAVVYCHTRRLDHRDAVSGADSHHRSCVRLRCDLLLPLL